MTLIASHLLLSRKDVTELRMNDGYGVHRVVYSLFENLRQGSLEKSESAGFLYADTGYVDQRRRILLLSNRPPIQRVSDRYGLVESKAIDPSFLTHERYRFKVVANPVINRSTGRDPIRKSQDIQRWFIEKASRWGFSVNDETLEATVPNIEYIQTSSGHRLVISRSTITGVLSVSDRETFASSFASGIGRGRAFGCGLLQIKPILSTRQDISQ